MPDSMPLTEARREVFIGKVGVRQNKYSTHEGKLKEVKQNDKLEIDAVGDKYAQRRT